MSKVVLGRGLEALIPGNDAVISGPSNYKRVSLDKIAPNPMQPRHEFDTEGLTELANSFKRDGVLQPLVVKESNSGYTIIAGERRYRAARLADLAEIPVVIIDDVDDTRMLELALIENLHREDLNPIETAEAYRRLTDKCGFTQKELAAQVGKSRAAVANLMRLLTLPASIQEMIRSGKLSEGHARAILALNTESEMIRLADQIVTDSLTVRQVERRTSQRKRGRRLTRRTSPEISEMETRLKHLLGTSVKITSGRKKSRIEIEYYGDDDLGRLWELFSRIER